MVANKRQRLTAKLKVRPFVGRGQIYAWLRAHYAEIEGMGPGLPSLWGELALDMAEDGVRGGRTGTPLPNNIRMAWPGVCRDVAAMEAALAAKSALPAKPKPPSRMPRDNHPPLATPPPAARPAPPAYVPRSQVAPPSSGVRPSGADLGIDDLPTTDPSGAPLPDGYVFYQGRSMRRHSAEQFEKLHRKAIELDRGK